MFDKDNSKGFVYNTDLLSNKDKFEKSLYCPYSCYNMDSLDYIVLSDEAIAYMHMHIYEQEMEKFLMDGLWKEGKNVLPNYIWDEIDMYVTKVEDLLEVPIVDEQKIVREVDCFIKEMIK